MKIWYQSALDLHASASNYRMALERHFEKVKAPDTEVSLHGRGEAGKGLVMSEIIGAPALYFKAITPVFVDAVLEAQGSGYDAFVIGTYSEPIVTELRSLSKIPVITMPEASMLLACSVAPKFALVTLSRVAVSYMYKTIAAHKLEPRVSGVYVVDEMMDEEVLDKHFGEPGPYLERFRQACRQAIRNGAQAIIPAEGMMASLIVGNGVTEVDGAPIVDPIAAPILFAELAVRMGRTTGVQQSRIAYPRPSAAGMKAIFGVDE
jgi:Asp/Glu/hydantoin racemase